MMDREISPPPLKRQRIANTTVLEKRKEPHALQFLRGLDGDKGADRTSSLGMVDTFRSLHPNTNPRDKFFGDSCDYVDMILCSQYLAARYTEAGTLATAADRRGPSDHVPIFASFVVQS
jgi:exonuclease III